MTKKSTSVEEQSVTFSFDDDGDDILFKLSDVSAEIVTQLALHGASQKGGDSYAGAKKASEELDVNPTEWSRAQVQGVIDQLIAGDWTVRQPGGIAVTDLARALAEAIGCPVEDAVAKIAETPKETRKELRAHPDIAVVLTRLASERAAAKAAKAAEKAGSGTDLGEMFGLSAS